MPGVKDGPRNLGNMGRGSRSGRASSPSGGSRKKPPAKKKPLGSRSPDRRVDDALVWGPGDGVVAGKRQRSKSMTVARGK